MNYTPKVCFFFLLILICFTFSELSAQQLVYKPINPSFGGDPLNGNWLMSYAQLQDLTEDPSASESSSAIDDFSENLQRSVLNQLSRQITESIYGEGGLTEGSYEFGDFSITVTEQLDGVNIVIFDIITGNETTIFIPYY